MNWFRRAADGHWLWPGFGENSRVLAWVFDRVAGTADAVELPDRAPARPGALDLTGLDLPARDVAELFTVDVEEWRAEAGSIEEYFAGFDRLPAAMGEQLDGLRRRLQAVVPAGRS